MMLVVRRAASMAAMAMVVMMAAIALLSLSPSSSPLFSSNVALLHADAITVHVVCHTHDDVGWLKTVDQYFVGLNNSIQHAMVQFILDSVIHELDQNSNRTFVYVEQAFFQRWWRQATDAQKTITQRVVANGQLEFINGGWCMHDEATTHYVDMIDQTTLGHTFLMQEFGAIPRIGWQIDPFGHSATQAALLSAEVGFDALFFGRIDYQDHDLRMANKNMEFVWRPSESLGPTAQVFAGAFQNGMYGPPPGLCFDQTCNDQQVQANPNLLDYNLDERVETFVQQALSYAQHTRGDPDTMNIMWTMGEDFEHENSHEWYKSLDVLIDAVNRDGRVKAMYSTPSRYVAAKNAEPVSWTVKTDDFFPYADGPNAYWTGYFTSRPALKRYVRMQSAFLQVARQLEVFTGGDGSATEPLWEAQSVAQHHDAVSGTEKQHVAYDYALRLSRGAAVADAMVQQSLATLVTPSGQTAPTFSSCPLANISLCEVTQNGGTIVAVLYNARARPMTDLVFVPISSSAAKVYNSSNQAVDSLVVPTVQTSANSASGSAPYTLMFEASVPGLGLSTYFIVVASSEEEHAVDSLHHSFATMSTPSIFKSHHEKRSRAFAADAADAADAAAAPAAAAAATTLASPSADTFTIQNNLVQLTFSSNGALMQATDLATGVSYPLELELGYYQAYQGNGQDDGAYIFLPDGTPSVNYSTPTLVAVSQSTVVSQVSVTYGDWLYVTVRLRHGHGSIEVEWTVGSVPIDDGIGKNVFVRYRSQIASNATWYTDSNGRELQQRVRNFRPSWKWNPTQPVTGNYYPVNAAVGLTDFTSSVLSVVVDRSQGVTSLEDGVLELMVHRRLLVDDGRGVGEPLNETMGGIDENGNRWGPGLVVTGTHYVHIGAISTASQSARLTQSRVYQPFHASFATLPASTSIAQYIASHKTSVSFLATTLPENVELMTLQARSDGSVLVRLSHQFGVNEDAGGLSNPATVDLSTLFVQTFSSVSELSLTANQPAGSHQPYSWNTTTSTSTGASSSATMVGGVHGVPLADTMVTLSSLQIRTFAFTL